MGMADLDTVMSDYVSNWVSVYRRLSASQSIIGFELIHHRSNFVTSSPTPTS